MVYYAHPQQTTVTNDVKDNRSGLGDGTNPGQGIGKTNSPNQGTNNPNNKPAESTAEAKLLSAILKI